MNHVKYRFHVILVCLLVLFGLICCQTSEKYTSDPTTVYFEQQEFNRITTLDKFSLVDFTVPEKPMLFHIIHDTILLVRNWTGDPFFLELYDIRNKKKLTSFLRRGRGPGEWLSAGLTVKSNLYNYITVFDIHRRVAANFYIDSILEYGDLYQPELFNVPDFAGNDIAFLQENDAIIFNKYHINDKRFSNKTTKSLFHFSLLGDQRNEFIVEKERHKNFTLNVSGGFIAQSPDFDKIFVFYQFENRIDLYDQELRLTTVFLGPKENELEYYFKDMGYNHVSFKYSVNTFSNIYYTSDNIYAIYNGWGRNSSHIMKISWEGALLDYFIIPDEFNMYVRSIYVDEKSGILYGSVSDNDAYPEIVKFNI